MKTNHKFLGIFLLVLGIFALSITPALAAEFSPPQGLVDKARITIESFVSDPELTWFRTHLKDAKGLLIVPQMLKGAFFLGGSGGRGILMVRDQKTGEWSDPAFYTIGGASFGIQFGGKASEVVLMVMTWSGIEALNKTSVKLGGAVSMAVGPRGAGVERSTAHNFKADYLCWYRAKGAFWGFSLNGDVVKTNNVWNGMYYGKTVKPFDITVARTVSNPNSADLRAAVQKGMLAAEKEHVSQTQGPHEQARIDTSP